MVDELTRKDADIAKLNASLAQLKTDFSKTSTELMIAQQRRDSLTEEIEQLKSSVLVLKASETEATLQLATLASRAESLSAQLGRAEAERDRAVQSMSSESSAVEARARALQEELHALKLTHADQLAAMQECLDAASASLAGKEAECAEKNGLIGGLSRSVSELTAAAESHRAEAERLSLQLESQVNNEQVGWSLHVLEHVCMCRGMFSIS
jgi:chromosome segregation ATPase